MMIRGNYLCYYVCPSVCSRKLICTLIAYIENKFCYLVPWNLYIITLNRGKRKDLALEIPMTLCIYRCFSATKYCAVFISHLLNRVYQPQCISGCFKLLLSLTLIRVCLSVSVCLLPKLLLITAHVNWSSINK